MNLVELVQIFVADSMKNVEKECLDHKTEHELDDDDKHARNFRIKTQFGPSSIEEVKDCVQNEAIDNRQHDAFFLFLLPFGWVSLPNSSCLHRYLRTLTILLLGAKSKWSMTA